MASTSGVQAQNAARSSIVLLDEDVHIVKESDDELETHSSPTHSLELHEQSGHLAQQNHPNSVHLPLQGEPFEFQSDHVLLKSTRKMSSSADSILTRYRQAEIPVSPTAPRDERQIQPQAQLPKPNVSVLEKLEKKPSLQRKNTYTSLPSLKDVRHSIGSFLSKLSKKKTPKPKEVQAGLGVILPGMNKKIEISTVAVHETMGQQADQKNDPVLNEIRLKSSNIVIKETANHLEFRSPRYHVRFAKKTSLPIVTNGDDNALQTALVAHERQENNSKTPFVQGDAKNMLVTPRVKKRNNLISTVQSTAATNARLFQFVKQGNLVELQRLFSQNEEFEHAQGISLLDVNYRNLNDGKKAPLHIAAKHNNTPIMELLISAGADVNITDNLQRTPLHIATSVGAHDCAILLVSHGAKLNVRDRYGNAPFHISVRGRFFDIAQDFILFGADINFKRQDGTSSLHEVMQRGDIEGLNFFIKLHEEGNRVLFNIRDEMGDTPFLRAIAHGQVLMINEVFNTAKTTKILLGAENSKGQNMFHIAASNNRANLIRILIEKFTPLWGIEEIVKALNLNDKSSGFAPIHCAAHGDAVEVIQLFQEFHAAHHTATHRSFAQKLFGPQTSPAEHINLDVNNVDKKGNTAIHTLLRRLISGKEEPHLKTTYCLQLLLQCKGLKSNVKNMEGETITQLVKRNNINLKDFLKMDLATKWLQYLRAQEEQQQQRLTQQRKRSMSESSPTVTSSMNSNTPNSPLNASDELIVEQQ